MFRDVQIEAPTTDNSSAGRNIVAVIGIDRYRKWPRLNNAVNDARGALDAFLRLGFEQVSEPLYDEAATADAIRSLVTDDLATLTTNDSLVLFFAGHGHTSTQTFHDGDSVKTGYIIPVDGDLPGGSAARWLRLDNWLSDVARLAVKHILVFLDACHSGIALGSLIKWRDSDRHTESFERLAQRRSRRVITSAQDDQRAMDGGPKFGYSLFTGCLIEGLDGGIAPHGDLVTGSQLGLYLQQRVTSYPHSVQTPDFGALEEDRRGELIIKISTEAPTPPLEEDANPYRGLQSFREEDRGLFFGREAVTRRLVDEVAVQQLTVIVGPPGCGKSSLVHAGLVPVIRAQGWTVLTAQRPGHAPLTALRALTEELRTESAGVDVVAAWLAAVTERAGRQPWLVIIDQLEELITHRTEHRERTMFLDALASALKSSPALHLIVTVRSDAESRFHDGALGPWWRSGRFVVPAMTRDQFRQIIEQPAVAAVLDFEPPRLVERLIEDVALVAAPLPLLSFVLSELYRACWARWRAGDHDRVLRETDYHAMGGVTEALTQRATALHDDLVAEDAAYAITIRNLFMRMVAVWNGDLARDRVPQDELVYDDPAETRRVAEVLKRFVDAHLISQGTERIGDGGTNEYVEATHDELVRGWTPVSQWLDELETPAGARVLLGAIADAVRSWRAHNQADSYLWSTPHAELAEKLGGDRPFVFNTHEALFIQRSIRVRRNRRTRLIHRLLAKRRLLACSYQEMGRQLLLDGRPFEAVAYLVEARRTGASGAPLRMLFAAASRNLVVSPLEHHRPVLSASFSHDGARVVTASEDKTARVWDALTGTPISPPLEHQDIVWGAAFSPDGTRVVTASEDKTAQIWDAITGKPLSSPLEHQAAVLTAAFSPDGTRVITASEDKTARLWDAATGRSQSPPLEHDGPVRTAVFSSNGIHVVTASEDNTARVWDATTGRAVCPSIKHKGPVVSAAFSPNGVLVVTASDDRTARVWHALTGQPVSPPLEHQAAVTSAAFSPDGTHVVTASEDKTARVWDVTTGKPVSKSLEHHGYVYSAGFSADGTRVVTASMDQTARVWDAITGSALSSPLEHQGSVADAEFSADGTRVVTASMDHTARVWDATTGTALASPFEHKDSVESAVFSPDGIRVATASSDRTARVWNATTGNPVSPPLEHHDSVSSAAFSPDGTRVVTTSNDRTARVWDVTTGKPVCPPLEHRAPVASAAFSSDGARVVTASEDQTARVWDAITGQPVSPPLEHHSFVWSAAFSPDGTRIITASADNTARIWDATSGIPLSSPLEHRGSVRSAAFSSDGTRIVTASWDNTARVWDAFTGKPISPPLDHQSIVWHASFSPDGTRVVTASHDRTARIWDASTGKPLSRRLEHRDKVWSASFSPDGTRVVTASSDRTARVWDAATGNPLSPPVEHQDEVRRAFFSPDGTRIVTASEDKTARVWSTPLDPGTLDDWTAIAARSPYLLVNGVLSLHAMHLSEACVSPDA